MIIKYLDCRKQYECQEDLSKEDITYWAIKEDDSTGVSSPYLSILWNTQRLTKFGLPSVGICPPVDQILNYKEVLNYLKSNHKNKENNE